MNGLSKGSVTADSYRIVAFFARVELFTAELDNSLPKLDESTLYGLLTDLPDFIPLYNRKRG
ncbi:hypothetical protein [Bacillus weihaiensis]|uniref:hypothetical protein n=1 Tax=Bacillus weihaiensis TaxID=1547283 RepID=UPI00235728A0|nr:hypothetical protein [Bacillus weihaiensis]